MYVQIVKFKLKPSSSRQKFLELTNEMIRILEEMDGFVAYELYEGSSCWSDRIVWESEKYAKEGLNIFLSADIAKQIIQLVDSDYSSFFGKVVASA
jgi:quinol monooxygenase YgiN